MKKAECDVRQLRNRIRRVIIAVLITQILIMAALPAAAADRSDTILDVNLIELTMYDGSTDVDVRMEYTTDSVAKFYMFLLGGRTVSPEINDVLTGYTELNITEVNERSATLTAFNASYQSDGEQVLESCKLNQAVDIIKINIPRGGYIRFRGFSTIPMITL